MADEAKAKCQYGRNCYRKNADHLKRFYHDDGQEEEQRHKGHEPSELEPPTKKLRQDAPKKTKICDNFEEDCNSPTDCHFMIKENFGIDMPQDFYDLWEVCQQLKPKSPQDALKDTFNLELVGPYDILAGKQFKSSSENTVPYSLHYRYFYDPPEFVTVLIGDDDKGLHLGYYRDNPDEKPVLVASNEAKVNCEFKILGNNIFAGISNSFKGSSKLKKSKEVQNVKEELDMKAKEKTYLLEVNPPSIKKRSKKVVTKTFHKIGFVVAVDENGVGYRDLQMSNAELKKMLMNIVSDKRREELLDELQDMITRVQFANDECDYGMGLELGLDLFSFGHEMFEKKAIMLLSLAYELLGKKIFGEIVERHLKHRNEEVLCEVLTTS